MPAPRSRSDTRDGLMVPDVAGIVEVFRAAKARQRSVELMWTADQRNRLALEHQILQREGFSQFSVYHYSAYDSYYASGVATSSSGRRYSLYSPDSFGLSDAAASALCH